MDHFTHINVIAPRKKASDYRTVLAPLTEVVAEHRVS